MNDSNPETSLRKAAAWPALLALAAVAAGLFLPDNLLLASLLLLGAGLFVANFRAGRGLRRRCASLAASEARLNEAQRMARTGSWSWDPRNGEIVWSDALYLLHGLDQDEPPRFESIRDRIVEEDLPAVDDALALLEAGEPPGDVEYRYAHPDGTARRFRARTRAVSGGPDAPLTFAGTVRELDDGGETGTAGAGAGIPERMRTLDELRKLSIVVEQSPVSVLITTTDGTIEYVNPRFTETTGYTAEEAIGQNPSILKSGRMKPGEYQAMWRTILGGDIWRGEFHNRKKNGDFYWEAASISPLRNDDGEITHFLAIKEEITERKKYEAQLEETNILLEEQTALANSLAAQAELANAAKSDFLANMSHEIRTPMNGVIGMIGLLLDTDLAEDQRRYAEIVRTSADSLLGLINDILDFSKIEAGRLEMESLDFDLRALMDDFAEMMALKTQEKGLELVCATAPDVPSLLQGDPGRLRQVLINLASNAVKFTHEGEIVVRADLLEDAEDSALVRFSVRDSGIGIPLGRIGSLFQKFTQVDASTTRKYGGTGLGLAISKQLAEAMGGGIDVSSEEGTGAEFRFTGRFLKQPEREQGLLLPSDLRDVRLLVVDNNASNRTVLHEQLVAWGARPDEAEGAERALELLREAAAAGNPYRVAVLDMQMKGMGGEELGKAIRADSSLADTRLVMMTSVGKRGDARRLRQIGFAAYLVKPVRHSDLFDTLATVLTGADRRDRPLVTRHSIREIRRGAVRILLAEDNIVNQKVALGILNRLALTADCVANGREAVQALADIPYDLVLMDCQMPEMDGYEATGRIRDPASGVRNHDVPVIAMTAHAMQGDREKCLDAGMNDYLSKPVNPQALADMLEKWLPEKGESAPPAPGKAASGVGADIAGASDAAIAGAAIVGADIAGADVARSSVAAELAEFLENLPRRVDALRGSAEEGDARGVIRKAGTILSGSPDPMIDTLREVASWIEQSGRDGDMETALTGIVELEAQIEELRSSLRPADR